MLMQCLSLRYRMVPVRNTPKGPMRLQGYAHFTNKLMAWRDNHNEHNPNVFIHVWHHRDKKKPVDDDDVAQSSEQAEEDNEQEEELVLPTPSMAFDDAAWDPISYPHPSSSGMPVLMRSEQTREDNRLGVPTFLGANIPEQTTNTALPESIYSPVYSSNFVPQNIYTAPPESIYSPVYSSNFVPQNIYSAADYIQDNQFDVPTFPGTNRFSQTTNTAPPESIYSPHYPSTFAPQNIYGAAAYPSSFSSQNISTATLYPCHLANPNLYSSPIDYKSPISTAPGFENIPTITNSVAMAPPNMYTQPAITYEARHDDIGLHVPSFPTVCEYSPSIVASQTTQPIATAIPAPVLPSENANTTFSSSEADPFMGADWSPEMSEDWL